MTSNKKYPKWIDEFTRSIHNAFKGMVPCVWGPIDGLSLVGFLNGSFISKLHKAITYIKNKGVEIEDVAKMFSCPSTLRAGVFYLLWEYQNSKYKDRNQFREVIEYLIKILSFLSKKDLFAYKSNICHTDEELVDILKKTEWQDGDREKARELGKLYNSLSALVFALYKDFFPQESLETYGPYDASSKFGKTAILLIKHFPKIKPVELWPKIERLKYSDIKIFQIYKNVEFRCEFAGFHSIYRGNVIDNLIAYSVIVDGSNWYSIDKIKKLTDYLAKVATKQSLVYESLSKEELKKKILEWECYQFVDFFKFANMDWRPTEGMWDAVKDKDIPDRFELESFPSFEEYTTSPKYEVYWLRDLYQ